MPSSGALAFRPKKSNPSATDEDIQAFTVFPYASGKSSDLQAFSDYELPIVEALVRYVHSAAGLPVKSTWLDSIKAVNFASWPGLTYQNAAKYFPSPDEILKGSMA